MRFPLMILLALVASAQDPSLESEAPASSAPAEGTEGEAAASEPVAASPAAPRTGGELLADATVALAEQRYDDALKIAIPAITDHPALGSSFEALALLATDQLARQAASARAAQLPPAAPAHTSAPYAQQPYAPQPQGYPIRGIGMPDPQAPRAGEMAYPYSQRRAHFGVDLGLPTGVRVEWKARREEAVVTGGGLRLGVNVMSYYGLYVGYDVMGFADVKAAENWEVELMGGVTAYSGIYPWPMVGAALQYDPEGPLQLNLGGRIGLYRAFSPDIGVGFLW